MYFCNKNFFYDNIPNNSLNILLIIVDYYVYNSYKYLNLYFVFNTSKNYIQSSR